MFSEKNIFNFMFFGQFQRNVDRMPSEKSREMPTYRARFYREWNKIISTLKRAIRINTFSISRIGEYLFPSFFCRFMDQSRAPRSISMQEQNSSTYISSIRTPRLFNNPSVYIRITLKLKFVSVNPASVSISRINKSGEFSLKTQQIYA